MVLGRSWGILDGLGTVLGRSWGGLGRSWGDPGVILVRLEGSWGYLGSVLGHLGGDPMTKECQTRCLPTESDPQLYQTRCLPTKYEPKLGILEGLGAPGGTKRDACRQNQTSQIHASRRMMERGSRGPCGCAGLGSFKTIHDQ